MSNLLNLRGIHRTVIIMTASILAWGCSPSAFPNEGSKHVTFTTIGMIPVIEGRINGKRAYFIVDTGASCSLLNESASKHFGFKYRPRSDEHVFGLGGQSKINQAYDYAVELGPVKLYQAIFRTKHLAELAAAIRDNEHLEIAGIIGADVLKRYGMTIDFNTNTIWFRQKARPEAANLVATTGGPPITSPR